VALRGARVAAALPCLLGGGLAVKLAREDGREGLVRLLLRRGVALALGEAVLEARLVLGRVGGGALADARSERATGARVGAGRHGARVGLEGRADLAVADVGEEAVRVRVVLLDLRVVARRLVARATEGAPRLGRVDGVRVDGVEPDHADVVVVPQRDDESHRAVHRVAHASDAALGLEDIEPVGEVGHLRGAHAVGDGGPVAGGGRRVRGRRVLDRLAVLDVEALHLLELARVSAVLSDELRDDRHRLERVELELGAGAVELVRPLAVGVEVAAVLVAHALEAIAGVGGVLAVVVAAVDALAAVRPLRRARVHRHLRRDLVRLPDVELRAARAVLAVARVRVRLGAVPADHVGLTRDPLEVVRALRVAVARAVLGARLVGRILGDAAVLVHLDEVDGAVEAARHVRHVHRERELLVQQLEHLVVVLVLQEVHPVADVGAGRALRLVLGDEREVQQALVVDAHAVLLRVALLVLAVDRARVRARRRVGARVVEPHVAEVAIARRRVGAAHLVRPAPVGVEHGGGLLPRAAIRIGAGVDRHVEVHLLAPMADLLRAGERAERQEADGEQHVCCRSV